MSSRMLTSLFAATALLTVGCDDSTGIDDDNAANVRVVHASASGGAVTGPIDVAVNDDVSQPNEAIAFGNTSECIFVDADDPDLEIQSSASGATIASPGPFPEGGRATVIVSGFGSNLRVTTIDDPSPTLQAGRARIRVFNGTTRAQEMDVTVTPFNQPASAVTDEDIGQAEATDWLEVPSGGVVAVRIRNANTTTDVAIINVVVRSGDELTLIAVDPATGSTDLRWVVTSPCEPADD